MVMYSTSMDSIEQASEKIFAQAARRVEDGSLTVLEGPPLVPQTN